MIKIFVTILFIIIFNSTFANTNELKKNEWVEINKFDSYILVNSNIVLNQKIIQYPKYEKLLKWDERKLAHGEKGYWISYTDNINSESKICDDICFSISYYEVEKSTWVADIHASYSPKKSIRYFYDIDKDDDLESLYQFTSKLKGFRSIDSWVNYRQFLDLETNQNCFIFGIQWHHGYEYPYAILDGIFCKSKNLSNNEFSINNIKNIINNIGVLKIRKIPLTPKFKLISKNNIENKYITKKNKNKYIYCKDHKGVYEYLNLNNKCYENQLEINKEKYLFFLDNSTNISNNDNAVSLEEKLIKLKDLFEKNLITENEYNNKKKELLESF